MAKSYSAEILDEADRSERILDWVLFCHEQENLLYEGGVGSWKPGKPVYTHPNYRRAPIGLIGEEGPNGNCVRPMIEEFNDGNAHGRMRCDSCEVSWPGPAPCWVCGKECPAPLSFRNTLTDHEMSWGMHIHSEAFLNGEQSLIVAYDVETIEPARVYTIAEHFRSLTESTRNVTPAMEEFGDSVNELANYIREQYLTQYHEHMDRWMHSVLWGEGNGENLEGILSSVDGYRRGYLVYPHRAGRSQMERSLRAGLRLSPINWHHQIDEWNRAWISRAEVESGIRRVHVPGEMVDGEYRPPATIEIPIDIPTTRHYEVPKVSVSSIDGPTRRSHVRFNPPVSEQRRSRHHG